MKYEKMTFNEKEVGLIFGVLGTIVNEMDEDDAVNLLGTVGCEMANELYKKIKYHDYCKTHGIKKMTGRDFENYYNE